MITTKAYITELPQEGSNIYKVNAPLMADNVNNDAIFEAILSHNPGIYNGYAIGDCVIVTFEDDKYNTAIIIGKLFTEVPDEDTAYGLFNQLNVTGSAVLPEDTKIGDYTPQDIFNLFQGVENKEGGINEDILKKYVSWKYTEEALEKEDDPTADDLRLYANKMRIDHVHWKAPFISKDEDGEYIDSEGNIILPTKQDIDLYSQTENLQQIHWELTDSEGKPWQDVKSGDLNAYARDIKLQFVQYIENNKIYPDKIIVMTGDAYSNLTTKDEHTLYFLSSLPTNMNW